MTADTLAFVGAAGGAGTTRITVEAGATLARAGWSVAIFDAAFTTQGLASYVDGRLDHDVTQLVTSELPLEDTLYDLPLDVPGRLAVCPARAPFERLSRAKTAGAAQALERQLAAASLAYDAVLIDTPPVGANQALAAVNAVDRIAVVTPDSERGADALALTRERLDDVGERTHAVIANEACGEPSVAADAHIPESAIETPRDCPACVNPDAEFAPAVADAVQRSLDVDLDLEFPDGGRLGGLVGSKSS
jgi:septum site-determining protein MinD